MQIMLDEKDENGNNKYEKVIPYTLDHEDVIDLLDKLPPIIDNNNDNFSNLCSACKQNAIDNELANILLNRLDENVKLDNTSFNYFCNICAKNTIDSELATNLLNRLDENVKLNENSFKCFCNACAENAIDSKLATNLLNRLDKSEKLDDNSFNYFCIACAKNTIDYALANNLLNRLKSYVTLYTTALTNFCDVCAENALNSDLVNILLDRWVQEIAVPGINSLLFTSLLKACSKNQLNEEQVYLILTNLNFSIDTTEFNNFCDDCMDQAIKNEKNAGKLLSLLHDNVKISKAIFENFCRICSSNVIDENVAKKLFEHKDFSFSEITQGEFDEILHKFNQSAYPLIAKNIRDDSLHNKIGLGVGIGGGTLLGVGLLALGVVAQFISFGIPNPFSIAFMAIGSASLLGFGGTAIYNGVKIHSKKQMINALQVKEKTSEGNNSTQTPEEDQRKNLNNQSWIQQISTSAIDKLSDTGENNIIPKIQDEIEEESDYSDPVK